ncbi:MAG: leucyl/phenylalanyl-tRNA--protein transferase [Pseudomonadota bacterium]|nr:leucyl/phenylalanyl-tRNA--protein transferase [Pseudomonadota bacterium]
MTLSSPVDAGASTRSGYVPAEAVSESAYDRLRRWALGAAWSLKPPRHHGVVPAMAMLARHWLSGGKGSAVLPDPEAALDKPDGLAGICGPLDVAMLVEAYRRGLFPWCHIEPLKWWAPAQRMVLRLENFDMEKNLRRRLRNGHFRVTFDRDVQAVMQGCAEARAGRWHLTWITPQIRRLFGDMFDAGYVHSVEVWDEAGELAGGLYGVAVGNVFFTESQFTRQRDASKVGFATLNAHLQDWGFVLNDGKHHTAHLAHMGFALMPRPEFSAILSGQAHQPDRIGRWSVDATLDVGNWNPASGSVPRRQAAPASS